MISKLEKILQIPSHNWKYSLLQSVTSKILKFFVRSVFRKRFQQDIKFQVKIKKLCSVMLKTCKTGSISKDSFCMPTKTATVILLNIFSGWKGLKSTNRSLNVWKGPLSAGFWFAITQPVTGGCTIQPKGDNHVWGKTVLVGKENPKFLFFHSIQKFVLEFFQVIQRVWAWLGKNNEVIYQCDNNRRSRNRYKAKYNKVTNDTKEKSIAEAIHDDAPTTNWVFSPRATFSLRNSEIENKHWFESVTWK